MRYGRSFVPLTLNRRLFILPRFFRCSDSFAETLKTTGALLCGTCFLFLLHARVSVSAQNDFFPIWNCKMAHGNSCQEVSFYVNTRENPDSPQLVTARNLSSSLFDATKPAKLLIHGYSAGMNLSQIIDLRKGNSLPQNKTKLGSDLFPIVMVDVMYCTGSPDFDHVVHRHPNGNLVGWEHALLQRWDLNVLTVHYLSLVDSPCYVFAVFNIRYVADCMETFVRQAVSDRQLHTVSNATGDGRILSLHVIGFSLGAHTAGLLGKRLKSDYTIERITGLDPAMPLFMTDINSKKLVKTDAERVDVYHTNSFIQGKPSHIGHIDFYFNGGITQPGCEENILKMLECDHHRALVYFSESINSQTGFWGWPCDSDLHMFEDRCPPNGSGVLAGQFWDLRSEGVYLVDTNRQSPFSRGKWWLDPTVTNQVVDEIQRNRTSQLSTISRLMKTIAIKSLTSKPLKS